MLFKYKYSGSSRVQNSTQSTNMSFAPDTLRTPTFFRGTLAKNIPFREAISALHDVVVSDLRWKPKDREGYKAWAAQQEQMYLEELLAESVGIKTKVEDIRGQLNSIHRESNKVLGPFLDAKRKFFNFTYKKYRDIWFVLDPVITIHPDEVFFECFSQDESSYGRLSCDYEVFKNIEEKAYGTTNIDYSDTLYKEFQKIRNYKETNFTVDPGGFEVSTEKEEAYKELKIDLPDSWVRGFLQVSSAMTMDAASFDLHPMDIYNFCFILKRHKEKQGPRSIRFYLKPGQPIKAVFEPWNKEVICSRSIYHGTEEKEIRIWGRRRLLILERLIPIAKRFRVHLLGTGLPSFFVADLGHMSFTLGLSGWTKNDWSRAGNFDLMAPRAEVDLFTKGKIFEALKETWQESADSLANRMNMDKAIIKSALAAYTQAGRVMYDMDKEVYRVRELSQDPLPFEQLRFANEKENLANQFVFQNKVSVKTEANAKWTTLIGTVQTDDQTFQTKLFIDADQRLEKASCECSFFKKNKLYKGPCEHILATRIKHCQKRR